MSQLTDKEGGRSDIFLIDLINTLSKGTRQKTRYDSLINGASRTQLTCVKCENLTEILEILPPMVVHAENYDKEKMFNLFRELKYQRACIKCGVETYHVSNCTLDTPPELLSIKIDSMEKGYEIFATQILQEVTFKVLDGNDYFFAFYQRV